MVELLIKNKANLESKDRFGGTPLEDAVRHNQKAVQAILREQGSSLIKGGADYCAKLCQFAASGYHPLPGHRPVCRRWRVSIYRSLAIALSLAGYLSLALLGAPTRHRAEGGGRLVFPVDSLNLSC